MLTNLRVCNEYSDSTRTTAMHKQFVTRYNQAAYIKCVLRDPAVIAADHILRKVSLAIQEESGHFCRDTHFVFDTETTKYVKYTCDEYETARKNFDDALITAALPYLP